jgi:hypothetical protein
MFKKDEVFITLLKGKLKLYTCTVTDRPLQTASRYCVGVGCRLQQAGKNQRTLQS